MAVASGTQEEAWATFTGALGFGPLTVGDSVASAAGAPALAGVVEEVGPPGFAETATILLDRPCPGIASLFAMNMGQSFVFVRLYLYGETAAATVATEEPVWNAWLAGVFPAPAPLE